MSNKSNILSPVLFSPCLYCIRKNKKKDTYTCESCSARADFALASEGNKAAQRRYAEFKYPDLGQEKKPPVPALQPVSRRPRRKNGEGSQRRPLPESHYESYFPTLGMAVNKKYGQNFKTMKETITWLYDKFKNQKHIAKNEFGTSEGFVYQMLNCYNIRKINKREVQKLWYQDKSLDK
jgi:hypothetical protein